MKTEYGIRLWSGALRHTKKIETYIPWNVVCIILVVARSWLYGKTNMSKRVLANKRKLEINTTINWFLHWNSWNRIWDGTREGFLSSIFYWNIYGERKGNPHLAYMHNMQLPLHHFYPHHTQTKIAIAYMPFN